MGRIIFCSSIRLFKEIVWLMYSSNPILFLCFKQTLRYTHILRYILYHIQISKTRLLKIFYYFFQILWKSRCDILVTFPSHLKKITFYTEILTRKVELWIFSLVSLVKKTPQNNFSCQNFSVEKKNMYYLLKVLLIFYSHF